ncbi:MAG: nucleoside deaminase [Opitutales bacterium]
MNFDSQKIHALLLAAHEVALEAVDRGLHPFGAVLAGPDGEILMRQGNEGTVRHAETELARKAAETYDSDFLWKCALVTTFEPCAMCAGTTYWANIGTLIYGVEETTLLKLTGNHDANPTLALPCRHVFEAGQKKVQVYGPYPELEDTLVAPHVEHWK